MRAPSQHKNRKPQTAWGGGVRVFGFVGGLCKDCLGFTGLGFRVYGGGGGVYVRTFLGFGGWGFRVYGGVNVRFFEGL